MASAAAAEVRTDHRRALMRRDGKMPKRRHGQDRHQAEIAKRHAEHLERPFDYGECGDRQDRSFAGAAFHTPVTIDVMPFQDLVIMLSGHLMPSSAADDHPAIFWRTHDLPGHPSVRFYCEKFNFF